MRFITVRIRGAGGSGGADKASIIFDLFLSKRARFANSVAERS